MRLDMTQHLRLEQRMKLAPRMIQSMEILQLPLMALEERIREEMDQNPVLEMRDGDGESPPDETPPEEDFQPDGERDLVVRDGSDNAEDFERLDKIADQVFNQDDFSDRPTYARGARLSGERDAKMDAMANAPAPGESLLEHLQGQWAFVDCEEPVHRAGELVIDAIDERGYLQTELADLVDKVTGEPTLADIEEALALVHDLLEPVGVGARSPQECLYLQLRSLPGDHALEIELVLHHLEDIEMNRYPRIAKATESDIEEIKRAIAFIRTHLDPHPGMQVGDQHVPIVMPDVIVDYAEQEDGYEIRLNNANSPRLYISGRYRRMLAEGGCDAASKEFLQKNVRSAKWLIESIEQRRDTVLRVVTAVVAAQGEFLENGPEHLRPLPMVQVADQLGIHVGTVSRAVAGKYIQTPRGIFRLRDFFTGGTETSSGESLSWDSIKAKMEQIINGEDKKEPLSDDRIVDELAKQGLTLARRTVAKYRQQLNIPPARRRREF